MMPLPRIGLFFCRCGPNLGQVIRLDELATSERWPCAATVGIQDILCSEDGKTWLAQQIREHRLERVVVAACSPREHEATFQNVLSGAGLNPYMLHMVNVREQCEWLGGDRGVATAKAAELVRAGLNRVPLHEGIEPSEIECNPDVLVVGAGAAGISAAIHLSQKGRKVIVAERSFALGGRVFLLDEAYPGMECASCFLEPALDKILHDERIQVFTGAEIEDVVGSYGNFRVTLKVRARHVDPEACLGCRSCATVCPEECDDPYSGGRGLKKAIDLPFEGCLPHVGVLDESRCLRFRGEPCQACVEACPFGAILLDEVDRRVDIPCGALILATGSENGAPEGGRECGDVLSTFQMERLIHPNGPTGGEVTLPSGETPDFILFALPHDARGEGTVGWMELLKLAERVRHKLPAAHILLAGGTAQTLGPGQDLVPGLLGHRAIFLPGTLRRIDRETESGRPLALIGEGEAATSVLADLVVVHTRSLPSHGTDALANLLRIRTRDGGFFVDRGSPFEPSFSGVAGIGVAGCAGGPRSIAASIQDGAAAAAHILSQLVPGETLPLEPLASIVDESLCSGCGFCRSACPYSAIVREAGTGASQVVAALCRGCGTCAAACPSGAIRAPHFTAEQLAEEIRGLLATTREGGRL